MSIDSDLQVLQNHLSEKLEIETSLVVRLQPNLVEEQSLVIWPWLIDSSVSLEDRNRMFPGREVEVQQPRLKLKIHFLILGNDLNILSRAQTVLHESSNLHTGETTYVSIKFSPLTPEQACSIFSASGVPMQTALSLILDTYTA
ncbi:hypothetical protein [Methylophaga sp.]|uniref:hypothetical protein n=1 Tax=Methylophaga sp. TaxID=2024840 RepID=UPI002717149C|nr:hypothetical protein [Methylophaga sp.]MDO8826203.1 hypothetical protein [Methylophaga sp.]